MDGKEHNNTGIMNGERSSDEIRQNIEREKDNISQTVEQIGERIKEKMDWREYMNDYPYLSMGAAAGIGYLASNVFTPRVSPVERIMRPLVEEARESLGGLRPGSSSPGLLKLTLVGIVTKVATAMLKNATLPEETSEKGTHSKT